MPTCPWCGTNYTTFQSNCENCGGTLPLPDADPSTVLEEEPQIPPPPPRSLPRNYILRLLFTDGWAVMAVVFTLIGVIFGMIGVVMTITIIAAFVGLPFAGIGALFLMIGVPIFAQRYHEAQNTVHVLQSGAPALGQIIEVYQNYNIKVNGRYPWSILYQFELHGQIYEGKVSTLSQPDLSQQPGKSIYVLYMQDNPEQNSIYPHPYGYFAR
jgi:hypothetical protein